MTDVREKVKTGIDTAADQAKSATDRGASVVGQVKHKAEEAVDAVGEYASEAKDKVQHFAEEAYDTAGDKLGTLSKDVTELVKKYPIQALLIGFGAGMLMGRASRA